MAVECLRGIRLWSSGLVLAGMVLAAGWAGGCAGQGKSVSVSPREVDNLRTNLRQVVAQSRDRVFPALVNIHVVTVDYYGGKEHKNRAVGSGTIISKDGYVVTNQHVTNDGKKFKCTLANEEEIGAALVGEDPLTDLAVLKLNVAERKSKEPISVAGFGNSDELQIGDYVMAMGSPFALSRSVTLGIVSNTKRVFAGGMMGDDNEEMQLEGGQRTGLFTQWIQHDAAINPGNSGGPLVNLRGEVIGINTAIASNSGGNEGIGFAIPVDMFMIIGRQLIETGTVARAFLGVNLNSKFGPAMAAELGLPRPIGAHVMGITRNSPAETAKLQPGDVILEFNDTPIEDEAHLVNLVSLTEIGKAVPVVIFRDRKPMTITVEVGDRSKFGK